MAEVRDLALRFALCFLAAVLSIGIIQHARSPVETAAALSAELRDERDRDVSSLPRTTAGPAKQALAGDGDWQAVRETLLSRGHDLEGAPLSARSLDAAIDRFFERTSDREIIDLLVEQTDYTREELEAVRDLRAFLKRNAEVYFGRAQGETAAETASGFTREIAFSRRVTMENAARNAQLSFGPQARKIYAAFPSHDIPGKQVTVVWRDLDRGRILQYQRHPIESGDTHSFVWIKASDSWQAGDYSVEVYTGDEVMQPVAIGTYTVSAD